jgi:gentisate 1,2-dioxygenase
MAMTNKSSIPFDSAADLESLHGMLDMVKMKNGWAKPTPSLYSEPKQHFVPAHWKFSDARPALHAAGRLVGTDKAERRNLIMANPIPGNDYATVSSLVGAYQMVKPGEVARSHRHTPNAMRIILEGGSKAYTIVDGHSIPMMPGDILLTPNGCYHGHDNQTTEEAYWIDILDVPLVQFLGPMFFEVHPDSLQSSRQVSPQSSMRFAFEDYMSKLMASSEVSDGVKTLLLGPPSLTTFDRTAVHLRANAVWDLPQATPNQIWVVLKGEGTTQVNGQRFDWKSGDLMAVPNWNAFQLNALQDSILIRMSDAPLMQFLAWDRTGRGFEA